MRKGTITHRHSIGLTVLLAACAPGPMLAPAPVQLRVPLAPAQVVQRAAQRLVVDGFTIATSDATGGILTATLTRRGDGPWGPFIACTLKDNTIAHEKGAATLTVRLTAQAAGAGSAVFAGSSTAVVVDAGSLSTSNETWCASSGLAEQHVAEAVTAP